MWSYARSGRRRARVARWRSLLFAAWIAVDTAGAVPGRQRSTTVAAGGSRTLAAPLASVNDQLALVTWFQQAAPPHGFGPGAVPWCGFARRTSCPGVPAQIQSDYTFTALVGVFGWAGAWASTLGVRAVAASRDPPSRRVDARRAAPRARRRRGSSTTTRRWSAGSCVAWVVLTLCQLGVTVAGNLAVHPAHRRDVSVRELRHDVAGDQHGDAGACAERRPAGRWRDD